MDITEILMKTLVLNVATCSMFFLSAAIGNAVAGTSSSMQDESPASMYLNLSSEINRQTGADPDVEYSLDLDEGTGRVATNGVTSNANGRLQGDTSYSDDTPDGSAYSVQFGGKNGYLDMGTLDTRGARLTLALWFKADSFPGLLNDARLISKATGVAADDHIFMLSTIRAGSSNRLRARVRIGGNSVTLVADEGNVSRGRWHHAAMTHDGVNLRLYLDGRFVGKKLARGSIDRAANVPIAAGAQPPGAGDRNFHGKLDAIYISRQALDESEVRALYQRRLSGEQPTGGGVPDNNDPDSPVEIEVPGGPDDTPDVPDVPDTPTIVTTPEPSPSSGSTDLRQAAAFPGALGWAGDTTTGGRGGRVVIVDTLSNAVDSNDGVTSFREAMTEIDEPRTIVFSVAGLIDYRQGNFMPESSMILNNTDSNVTIACQTAPAPGVTLMGDGINFSGQTNNVIMRHCRFRNSDPRSVGAAENSSCIRATGTTPDSRGRVQRNYVLDHVSCMWAADDPITFAIPKLAGDSGGNIENITLSNSIVAEGDADSKHSESGRIPQRYTHSMGPSCSSSSTRRTVDRCSMVRNFLAHNGRRNGRMWAVKEGELVNNIIYNANEVGISAKQLFTNKLDAVIVGNLIQLGPTSKGQAKPIDLAGDTRSGSKLKISGNYLGQYRASSVQPYNNPPGNYSTNPITRQKTPTLDILSMAQQGGAHMRCVGASRPARDSHDARVIEEFHQHSGQVGVMRSHERDFSEYPTGPVRQSWADSDKDGMPDTWETKMGVENPGRKDLSSTYTNLEVFINNQALCPTVSFQSDNISSPAGTRQVSVAYDSTWETWAGGQSFRICVDSDCSRYDSLPAAGSLTLTLPADGAYQISMTPIRAGGQREPVSASANVTIGQ